MRTSWPLWHCISEESKKKLQSLMPKGWRPPGERPDVHIEKNIEDIDELTRIMEQRPKYPKRRYGD